MIFIDFMENIFITPKKTAELLSVTIDCLRKWEEAGKITAIKTMGGHRRYSLEDIKKLTVINKHNTIKE